MSRSGVYIMNESFLLIGGNLGDRERNLSMARELINKHCGAIIRTSSLYETAAWGMQEQPSFLNQALLIQTSLNARQLMRRILKIEKSMGRVRGQKLGPRIIDIDILLFGDEIHNAPFLKIPHPEMQNRRFALEPLSEIAAGSIHPLFKKSVSELLKECNDLLEVKKTV